MPSITDIVLGNSTLRGKIILGIKSGKEFLEFKQNIVMPNHNYMLPDALIE